MGLVVAYYFAIYLPAKLKNNEYSYLQCTLRVGDKVVTKSGLVGSVFQVSKTLIILSLFDGTLVEVERESIVKKL
jgi:preprotein translocase subunit YajC